jgi:predicted transcriptional regulator
MREKLKKMELRLTELSNYLDVSRPTLYKYIDDYDHRRYKNIDSMILDVFRFINKKTTISKIQVIDFIIRSQKNKLGLKRSLIDEIEWIVIDSNRGEELLELIKLFRRKNSKEVIHEIINQYIRSEDE